MAASKTALDSTKWKCASQQTVAAKLPMDPLAELLLLDANWLNSS